MGKWYALLLSLTALFTQAQSWSPPGAQWHYSNDLVSGESPGYRSVTYNGDTVLYGQPCKRLLYDEYWIAAGELQHITAFRLHTYEEDDVIYFVSSPGLLWDTLYWMGADVGDHWHLAGFPDDDPCNRMTVTATGSTEVNGHVLPYLDYELDSMGVTVERRIVQRLGDLYDFWTWPLCEFGSQEIKGLRCYQDDEFGLYSTGLAPMCDFTNGMPDASRVEGIVCFPNPGTTHVSLTLSPGQHHITLFDATGRMALHQRSSGDRVVVGTAHLPSGIYQLRVNDDM